MNGILTRFQMQISSSDVWAWYKRRKRVSLLLVIILLPFFFSIFDSYKVEDTAQKMLLSDNTSVA